MVQFLTRTHKDDQRWQDVAVRTAKDFLSERRTPKYRVLKNDLRKIVHHEPHRLAREVMHDFRRAKSDGDLGAGISEAISSVFGESKHLLGIDKLMEWIGGGPKHKPLSDKEKDVASAVQQSYKSIADRKSRVGKLKRLPEYDTDQISVWQETDKELLVCVRGTKLNWNDLGQDAQIMFGGEVRSSELQTLLHELDTHDVTYDLAGHSLGTQYIQNAVKDGDASKADDIYLFNPASSPFQSTDYLQEGANNPKYTYFINQGDIVSRGLYSDMDQDTMDNRVHLGPYRYDPVTAHFMDQWVDEERSDDVAAEESKKSWNVQFKGN